MSALAVRPAITATAEIPIVFVAVGDPVGFGFVASLERPGGNVTGLSDLVPEAAGERLELLAAVMPGLRRVAVLRSPLAPPVASLEGAARTLGVTLIPVDLARVEDAETAFDAVRAAAPDGLIVVPNPVSLALREQIVAFAAAERLPAAYGYREFVEAGGLLSYGADVSDLYRRAAGFVVRILVGERPAEMRVERPAAFELALNRRTAAALGLAVPDALIGRATIIQD